MTSLEEQLNYIEDLATKQPQLVVSSTAILAMIKVIRASVETLKQNVTLETALMELEELA